MSEKQKETIIEIKEEKIEEVKIEENTQKKQEDDNYIFKALFWFVIACASSVSMTVFNKKLAIDFPYPFLLIAIQNFGSLILTFIFQFINKDLLPLKPPSLIQLKALIIPTASFILLLWTSLEGLALVSVPLVIVARNSS